MSRHRHWEWRKWNLEMFWIWSRTGLGFDVMPFGVDPEMFVRIGPLQVNLWRYTG